MLLHLQDISDSSNETSQSGAGNSSLVGGAGEWRSGRCAGWCWLCGVARCGRLRGWDGAIRIDRGGIAGSGSIVSRSGSDRDRALSGADGGREDGGVDLGAGARAVGDGQSGGLGDSVGLVILHNGSGQRAVGGIRGDNLSGSILSTILDNTGRGTSNDGENGSDSSETHYDKFYMVFMKKLKNGGEILELRGGCIKTNEYAKERAW